MKKLINAFLLILLLIAVSTTCFAKEDEGTFPAVPTSNIYLQDYAKVTNTETNKVVMNTSTNLKKKTTAQVVVVTIDNLNGIPISDYSLGLFRKWGIGNKEKNNGILILVVSSTKQVRIEVGYGLEGSLPDSKCGDIIRDKMKPLIDQGDFNSGILAGYKAVIDEVAKEYGVDVASLSAASTSIKKQISSVDLLVLFLALPLMYQIPIIIIILFMIYVTIRIISSGDGMFFLGSGGSSSGGSDFFDSFGGGSSGGGGGDD